MNRERTHYLKRCRTRRMHFSLQQFGTGVAKSSSSMAGSTDRCSSAKLFIRRNPVGGGDAVVVAGGEVGDGATRPCRETLIPWHLKSCILHARLEVRVRMHDLEPGFFTFGALPILSYTLRSSAEAFLVFPFGIPEGCRYTLEVHASRLPCWLYLFDMLVERKV
jgi:hypothetical protein